jgi:hypothetical protein
VIGGRAVIIGNLAAMLTVAQQNEKVARNWRPFHAGLIGCGGVQPAVLAVVERRGVNCSKVN